MTYTRFTALWTGTAGLPGYTRIKFDGDLDNTAAGIAAGRVKTFFQTIVALLPSAVTITVQPTAQVFTVEDVLTGERTFTGPSALVGGATGTFAAPAGACINWLTGAVLAGRKLKGRTFIVPLASSAFESDGTLLTTTRTNLTDAANGLRTGTPAQIINGHDATAGSLQSPVTSVAVNDRVAVLRSRRG